MSQSFLLFVLLSGAPLLHASTIAVDNREAQDLPASLVTVPLRFDELLLEQQLDLPVSQNPIVAHCNIAERIGAARKLLEPVPVDIGTKKYRYTERRVGSNVRFEDPEKTIALALMDSKSCELRTTVITKRGDVLIAGEGYVLEAVRRSNGIQWNNWGTEFHVLEPEHQVVILLKYPYARDERGARVVTSIYYTPYSKELHRPELVRGGKEHLDTLAIEVYADLRGRNVVSRADPTALIVDVAALRPEYIIRLAPIEHMDLTEFLLDPLWTTERIHIVIGANLDRVATYTCSKASACGLMQFTKGTYKMMRELYPSAGLIESFEDGARDQRNAMKAALLLHDYNASELVASFGSVIMKDARLEEYLAAAYNTGIGRVLKVLALAKKNNMLDWTDARGSKKNARLLPETKGYIAKLRFLRDTWSATQIAQVEIKTPNQ